jgi:hypothetical protein
LMHALLFEARSVLLTLAAGTYSRLHGASWLLLQLRFFVLVLFAAANEGPQCQEVLGQVPPQGRVSDVVPVGGLNGQHESSQSLHPHDPGPGCQWLRFRARGNAYALKPKGLDSPR